MVGASSGITAFLVRGAGDGTATFGNFLLFPEPLLDLVVDGLLVVVVVLVASSALINSEKSN